MQIMTPWQDFEILATSEGKKTERWGKFYLQRPDPQIIWKSKATFPVVDAKFEQEWKVQTKLPGCWTIKWNELKFNVRLMGFKQTGVFPEQSINWEKMQNMIRNEKRVVRVLNLFAYTGGATLACASAGAEVCHVDSVKSVVEKAKENAFCSGLQNAKIRYIVDDCRKFVEREQRRGNKYDAIIMDPPSYGKGTSGEVWKIEKDLFNLVKACAKLLSDKPVFFLINTYTTNLSKIVTRNMLSNIFGERGNINSYELAIKAADGMLLSCGSTSVWSAHKLSMKGGNNGNSF